MIPSRSPLAALILQIETLQAAVQNEDRAGAQELLTQARGLAKSALEDTRRAVRGLASADAQGLSPAQAVAQEAQQLETESGILTQFIQTGEEHALTPDQRASLLRITQEALTNARKHARPQRVRVGLQFQSEDMTLLIEDDGTGFDAAAPRVPGPESGYGLFGMSERARLIGADLQIDSTPGWGTRIRLMLPYRPSSPIVREEGRGKEGKWDTLPAGASVVTKEASNDNAVGNSKENSGSINNGKTPSLHFLFPHQRTDCGRSCLGAAGDTRPVLQTQADIAVIGEASDGAEGVTLAESLRPDVVLMDLQMPNVNGLEALRRMHVRLPDVPVVILTTFQTEQDVTEALAMGARGFLLKDADPAELLAAVRAAQRGDSLLSPTIADRLVSLASGQNRAGREDGELNEREREVLQLLAQGARNKEIATALFIAPKTVEYHLSNIFTKLQVSNRTEAARIAVERGLVAPGFRSLK